jgi:hypothetical protein
MADPWKRKEVIGDCVLYQGDCLEVMPALEFDAICADPPYGISFSRGSGGGGFGGNKRFDSALDALPVINGDETPFDPSPFLKASVPTILWGANHYADKLPTSARWLIWDKRRGTATNDFADCEMAWTISKAPPAFYRICGMGGFGIVSGAFRAFIRRKRRLLSWNGASAFCQTPKPSLTPLWAAAPP